MEKNISHANQTFDNGENLVMLFRKAAKMMSRAHHRHAHAYHAQAHVYSLVKERGPISQKELMQILDVRSSSLSEILSKLEQSGVILRERNSEDKRGFIVSTVKGVTPPFAVQEEKIDDKDFLFAVLSSEEKQQLSAILKKLIENVKNDDKNLHCSRHEKHHREKHHGKRKRQKP